MGEQQTTVTRISTRRGVITRVTFATGEHVDFVGPMPKRVAIQQANEHKVRGSYAVSKAVA